MLAAVEKRPLALSCTPLSSAAMPKSFKGYGASRSELLLIGYRCDGEMIRIVVVKY